MADTYERHYEVFLKVAARLQEIDELQAQLDEIVAGVVEARTFRRALISLLDDDWNVVYVGAAGVDDEELDRLKVQPPLRPEERRRLLDERYRIGESYFIPHEDPSAREVLKDALPSRLSDRDFIDWHPDDMLFLPMYGRNRKIIGTLAVDDPCDGRRPTAESLRILELFAREAAATVERRMLTQELERVRTYLETIISSIPDAIITIDNEAKVVLFNDGAVKLSGYEADEMIGRSVIPLYASDEVAKLVMFGLRAHGPGKESGRIVGQEVLIRSKSGEEIPASLSASILVDSEGNEIGSAGVLKDLRPLRKLEKKLLKAERIAAVGEVATLMSHEVNNFLSSILSAAELSHQFLQQPEVKDTFRAAGLEKEVEKEMYRLRIIQEEALRVGQITDKLQMVAMGREYETTDYIGGVSMFDVEESIEKMTRDREVRILIADDRVYIRKFLREMLEAEGFRVDDVEDGVCVLAEVEKQEYDLVISDIRMPKMNGYEVSSALKDLKPDLPVILITAYGYDPTHSAVRAKKEANVVAILYKPFDLGKLKGAIDLALAKKTEE